MLRLTVTQIAKLADVAPNTVVRIEAGKPVNTTSLKALQAALEAAGAEFIPENEGGAGVRMRTGAAATGPGDKAE